MAADTRALHSLITTPIVDGDYIYGVDSYGELRGLDARTGERLWVSDEMTAQRRWGAAFMVRHGDRRTRSGNRDAHSERAAGEHLRGRQGLRRGVLRRRGSRARGDPRFEAGSCIEDLLGLPLVVGSTARLPVVPAPLVVSVPCCRFVCFVVPLPGGLGPLVRFRGGGSGGGSAPRVLRIGSVRAPCGDPLECLVDYLLCGLLQFPLRVHRSVDLDGLFSPFDPEDLQQRLDVLSVGVARGLELHRQHVLWRCSRHDEVRRVEYSFVPGCPPCPE